LYSPLLLSSLCTAPPFLDVVVLDALVTIHAIFLPISAVHPLSTCQATANSMMRLTKGQGGSESVRAASPSLNLIPCEWNPVFATRRSKIDYSIENKPYIETRGVDESVVRTFMQDSDESDVCLPQADKVEAYCFGANLESLAAGNGEASERFVAFLDERSFPARGGRSRPYRGPLTACDLYRELKKPVRCLS
jgi:hypothetical protein